MKNGGFRQYLTLRVYFCFYKHNLIYFLGERYLGKKYNHPPEDGGNILNNVSWLQILPNYNSKFTL